MKQTLQLKLSQHLTLTPQLQQSIRLLQLSTLELNQELERFLMENPLLERDDPAPDAAVTYRPEDQPPQSSPPEEAAAPQDTPSDAATPEIDWSSTGSGSSASREDGDEPDLPALAADTTNLRTHLLEQIVLLKLEYRDRMLVALLVDALDEDGYLTQPLEELLESLPVELGVEIDELQIALRHLQQLDPTGEIGRAHV